MATLNLYDAEEIDFESSLIPEGTIVGCTVIVKNMKTSDKGNTYMDCEFIVKDGLYKGSKFFENIGVSGSEGFVRLGSSKMKAILETGRGANKPADYEVDTQKLASTFNGAVAVVRVKVDFYQKDGKWHYKNAVHSYGSPRPDSKRYHIFEAYSKNQQPYQTMELPPLPATAPAKQSQYAGSSSYGEPPAYVNEGPQY
jgi:hypothetical protein